MSKSGSGNTWADPLGRRLLAAILFCSTALALIATGSQLLLDYRQGVTAIESRMKEIEHAYVDSVGASLWTMDEQQTRKQIEGIARLPDIVTVELRDPVGKFLMRAGGANITGNTIRREIPIKFAEDDAAENRFPLGTLNVTASLDNLYGDLQDKALLILVTQTTKTAIVAFFTLFIFRRMVSRHLSAIAAYARRLDLKNLGDPLALRRRKRKTDELDVVVAAFNDMANSIKRDFEELASYRNGLEQLVASRTEELAQKVLEKEEVIRQLNREMTERQLAEQAARDNEERYRQVVEMSPDAIMIERDGRIVFVNRGTLELLGAPDAAQIKAMTFLQLIPIGWRDRMQEKMDAIAGYDNAASCFEGRMVRFDGKVIDVEIRRAVFQYEGAPAVQTVIRDITSRKDYEDQLRKQALHDTLTGLPNRALLMDRLEQAIVLAERRQHAVFVLFFDLDRFKYVNDTLGHDAGDDLLRVITDRMAVCARKCDTLARLGGDEFVMVVDGIDDVQAVPALVQRIMERICEPVLLRDQEVAVTCSVGISAFPYDADDAHTLLKYADTAMYHAKEKGRNNYERYNADMHSRVNEHLMIESHLRRALERNEFLLHYQPLLDLRSGRVIGAEALIRWRHPELGMVAPVRFIPLAEEIGLIAGIGDWVLRTACRQAREWHDAGFKEMQIAVNLSAQQLTRANLDAEVAAALAEAGLPPQYLELEITESTSMKNPERTVVLLARLKEMGMSIAIDDFGTGYSNLSYLKRFPVDRLKLDRSFVSDITNNPEDSELAQAIIAMARSLRLTVVAEGVEDAQQVGLLRAYGCDQMQGYYFSAPLTSEEFAEVLRSGRMLEIPAAA